MTTKEHAMKSFLLFIMIFSTSNIFAYNQKEAMFSAGKFWCVEHDFARLHGVLDVVSGYTDHEHRRETIHIKYNEDIISYPQLLNAFFRMIDPTDGEGSFNDRGFLYSPAIYTFDDTQNILAREFIQKINESKHFTKPIAVEIIENSLFIVADERQQDFAEKNSSQYSFYRNMLGRDAYIRKVWQEIPQEFLLVENTPTNLFVDLLMSSKLAKFKKPSRKKLKTTLTEMQFSVTQDGATEPPAFEGNYHDSTEIGIYVDVVSGEPLFSSKDKILLDTGLPSFTKPISDEFIVIKKDLSLFVKRWEIRSRYGDSHIGYVENDFYHVNGSALRFIPYTQLKAEGYEAYW